VLFAVAVGAEQDALVQLAFDLLEVGQLRARQVKVLCRRVSVVELECANETVIAAELAFAALVVACLLLESVLAN
jgi:hypothetical protein